MKLQTTGCIVRLPGCSYCGQWDRGRRSSCSHTLAAHRLLRKKCLWRQAGLVCCTELWWKCNWNSVVSPVNETKKAEMWVQVSHVFLRSKILLIRTEDSISLYSYSLSLKISKPSLFSGHKLLFFPHLSVSCFAFPFEQFLGCKPKTIAHLVFFTLYNETLFMGFIFNSVSKFYTSYLL